MCIRDRGNHETIPTTSLVPGDIVVIRAGDRIPADLRVIEAHNLRVEEAILTGAVSYTHLMVRVPVLSEQITVIAPRVSTVGSLRIIAF